MPSKAPAAVARYVAGLVAAGGLVLLALDALSRVGAPAVLLGEVALVGTGLLGWWLAGRAAPGASAAALAVVAVGGLAAAVGSRPWIGPVAGALLAIAAPFARVRRRAAVVWTGVAVLLALPLALQAPLAGLACALMTAWASRSAIRLAAMPWPPMSRSEIELEQALDAERYRVAQLQAELGWRTGGERREPRRAMLRGALTRRLGTIEALGLMIARELTRALLHTPEQRLGPASRRCARLARRLAQLAAGGRVQDRQATLPLIWPRVHALLTPRPDAGVVVRAHLPDDLPAVAGAGETWVQVLVALVENALAASPPGSSVEVVVKPSPRSGMCRIVVADRGRGMPPDVLAAVMQQDSADGGPDVEGLGLAMVISQVEGLGGAIAIESGVGAGTRVEIDVPFASGESADQLEELEGVVLVADDDQGVRRAIAYQLESVGLDVVEVDNGTVARSRLLADLMRFRCAVLDVVMPGDPVEDVVVSVRAKRPDFPFVLVSGYDTMQMVDALLALGGIRFLRKPFRREDLYRALVDVGTSQPDIGTLPAAPSA
jgi:signal transduction histidine kinase/ActR/RegA family two-component response regulator